MDDTKVGPLDSNELMVIMKRSWWWSILYHGRHKSWALGCNYDKNEKDNDNDGTII